MWQVPGGGWTQILLYMGWCEVSRGAGSDIASGRPGAGVALEDSGFPMAHDPPSIHLIERF